MKVVGITAASNTGAREEFKIQKSKKDDDLYYITIIRLVLAILLINSFAAMSLEIMQVKRLSSAAILPTRGSPFAAGFDLSSAYACVVPARGKALVKTDLAIAIPLNTYARIGNVHIVERFMHIKIYCIY
jgi:hypothetical protein